MNFRSPVFLPVFLLFVFCAANAGATVKNVGPADNWCAAVNTAAPGDQVIFSPGTYTQACTITVNGSSGSPIVIGSASSSSTDRAVLAYAGSSANLFDLQNASFLTIRWLTFQNTQAGVDAIKVRAAHDIAIQANTFQNIGGISVSANAADSDRVSIVDNTFSNLKATALYLGCQDGAACHARDVDVERNLISGVTSSGVGYGMEVKLNSYGVVRDNTLYNTQGPGICVYGSNNGSPASTLQAGLPVFATTSPSATITGASMPRTTAPVIFSRTSGSSTTPS